MHAARESLALPRRRRTPDSVIADLRIHWPPSFYHCRPDGTVSETRVGLLGDPERRTVSYGQMSNHDRREDVPPSSPGGSVGFNVACASSHRHGPVEPRRAHGVF
jgi:hypothetical protein